MPIEIVDMLKKAGEGKRQVNHHRLKGGGIE
jgi:hypothetical protein